MEVDLINAVVNVSNEHVANVLVFGANLLASGYGMAINLIRFLLPLVITSATIRCLLQDDKTPQEQ